MPSLGTTRANIIGTYGYYIPTSIQKTQDVNLSSHMSSLLWIFSKMILQVALFVLLFAAPNYITTYLITVYDNYIALYFQYSYFILIQCAYTTCTIYIFLNPQKRSLLTIIIISIIFNIIIGGSILLCILSFYLSLNNYVNMSFGRYCYFFDCNSFSFYWIYTILVYPHLWYFASFCACYCIKADINCFVTTKQTDLSMHLLHSENDFFENKSEPTELVYNKSILKYFAIYWTLFCIFWIFMYPYNQVSNEWHSRHINQTHFFFWYLYTLCFIFKYILKKISRVIDRIRICSQYNNKQNLISFELFNEYLFCVIYLYYYRYLVILELSFADTNELLLILFTHLSSEIFHSLFRFSSFYYHLTLNFLKQYKCKGYLDSLLRDESTLYEWKTRQAVDCCVRVVAVIVTGVTSTILFFIFGEVWFELEHENYYHAMLYNIFFISLDCIYFLLVFMITKKQSKFNIWKPYLVMYSQNMSLMVIASTAIPVWVFIQWT
eukprot:322771_1